MKLIIFLSLIVFFTALCQDIPPYKIVGDRTLKLDSTFLAKGMTGNAMIHLLIDAKCNILNFAIVMINISDEKKENVLIYSDKRVFSKIRAADTMIYKKKYYPNYIQFIYNPIKEYLENLKIIYSDDTQDLKPINHLIFNFSIK